jgi:hypothetical protein
MKNQTRILSLLILACLVFLISCTKETIIEPDNVISTWYELHKNPNTLETVQWDKMTTLQLSDSSIAYSVPAKDSVNFKELVFFKEVGKQEAVYKVYSPLKNGLELKVYSVRRQTKVDFSLRSVSCFCECIISFFSVQSLAVFIFS